MAPCKQLPKPAAFAAGELARRCKHHRLQYRAHAICEPSRRSFAALLFSTAVWTHDSAASAADPEGKVYLVQADDTSSLTGYQKQVLEYNQRIQRQNKTPVSFPSFIRDKFDITVVADGYKETPEGT